MCTNKLSLADEYKTNLDNDSLYTDTILSSYGTKWKEKGWFKGCSRNVVRKQRTRTNNWFTNWKSTLEVNAATEPAVSGKVKKKKTPYNGLYYSDWIMEITCVIMMLPPPLKPWAPSSATAQCHSLLQAVIALTTVSYMKRLAGNQWQLEGINILMSSSGRRYCLSCQDIKHPQLNSEVLTETPSLKVPFTNTALMKAGFLYRTPYYQNNLQYRHAFNLETVLASTSTNTPSVLSVGCTHWSGQTSLACSLLVAHRQIRWQTIELVLKGDAG